MIFLLKFNDHLIVIKFFDPINLVMISYDQSFLINLSITYQLVTNINPKTHFY